MEAEAREMGAEGEESERPAGEEEEGGIVKVRKPWGRRLLDFVFPMLTLYRGREELSRLRSVAILSTLYTSHVFSAWGDRMWQFLVFLLLASLYPGSLLLPAVFGLVLGLLVAVFGTLVGDWVDMNPRMKVAWMSLLVQNGLLVLCAVVLSLMFGLDMGICDNVPLPLFISLSGLVILLGSGANLATVANTIAIEKDWIVVIADKNKDTLAALNANMRRIDLICKLLAPAIAGVILQYTGPLTTTMVTALWNVVSFFAELSLLYLVYRWVPTLAQKKFRKPSTFEVLDEHEEENSEAEVEVEAEGEREGERGGQREGDLGEGGQLRFFDEEVENEEEQQLFDASVTIRKSEKRRIPATVLSSRICTRLFSPYTSVRDGWRTYIHQEVALAGLSMATIYLTVLGFSGVTSTYFLTQGLRNDLIGLAQGAGAILGVSGTIVYPFFRRRIGTVRTGLFGISFQLAMLLLCVVAVLIPGHRVANPADSYYAAHCPADSGPSNTSIPFCDFSTTSTALGSLATSLAPLTSSQAPLTSSLAPLTSSQAPLTTSQAPLTSSLAPLTSSRAPLTSSQPAITSSLAPTSPTPFPSSGDMSSGDSANGLLFRPIREAETDPESELSLLRPIREAEDDPGSEQQLTSTLPQPTCSLPSPSQTASTSATASESGGVSAPLVLMLLGVLGARFGLWIFDLAVQQLVQETVAEETRGVVGGVMNAMNSVMDMLHYVMVIAAPRPEHFTILTLISFAMVALGAVLYSAYLRKVRGHFFHCRQYYQFCRDRIGRGSGQASFSRVRQAEPDEGDQNYLVNENVDEL